MDAEQLVAEIARTTGVRLSTADPILAAALINEVMLDKALAKLDRQVKAQADRVTLASAQSIETAKKQAEMLLTEAGVWAETRLKSAAEAAAAAVINDIRQERVKVERVSRVVVRAAWATGLAVFLAFCGFGGMLLAQFSHS